MNSEQHSNIINRLSDVINDDRVTLLHEILEQRTRYVSIVLDDIYQPQNASAIMRTCECLGVQDLHIIEDRNDYTINRDVVKGSSKWITLKRYKNSNSREDCLQHLKQHDYKIVAMTLSEDSMPLEQLPVEDKIAICFGCEETGLSETIEKHADYKVQIPIHGFTQSYNVSVSAGISLYFLINKIKNSGQNWQLDKKEKESLLMDWLSKSTPTGKILLDKYQADMENGSNKP